MNIVKGQKMYVEQWIKNKIDGAVENKMANVKLV